MCQGEDVSKNSEPLQPGHLMPSPTALSAHHTDFRRCSTDAAEESKRLNRS